MSDWTTTGAIVLGSFVVLCIGRQALWSRPSNPLPPGPPGLPWVGNIIGVNTDAPWITYAEWAKVYGGIVYSRLLGKEIIIINSETVAKDLLENRSKNYSDRPYFIANEMSGLRHNSPFLPYGERWRLHRRFFHQTFRPAAVHRFLPYQHRKSCNLLRRLFDSPDQLDEHIFEYTAAIIMNSVYDYDPTSRKDKLVEVAANTLNIMTPVLRADVSVILGAFPWLLYLPSWLPGMSFKRDMARAREYSKQYLERPFQYALRKVRGNAVTPSLVNDAMQEMEEKGLSPDESWMDDLKQASGSVFLAASETSNSVLMTFFLLMIVNPGAQEKAQAEIDAVVGNTRLPTVEDRPHLPFVDALVRETLRHSPVAPLGVPHAAVYEDVYSGFRIPKGAFLVANLWSMAHDETKYSDPYAFVPERFLNEDGSLKPNDTEHLSFGFGRRICVGRHLADNSVWLVISKVLAVFQILKALDTNGVEILVEPKFSSGIVIQPLPFKYRIVPRLPGMDAEKLEKLIAASDT